MLRTVGSVTSLVMTTSIRQTETIDETPPAFVADSVQLAAPLGPWSNAELMPPDITPQGS